jgi:ribosomal protein S15P/S13E
MNRFPTFGRTVLRRQFATTPQIPLNPFIKLKDFRVAYPEQIENVFSLSTANQEEITQHKISLAIARFQKHDGDTGSTTVQLAVITEKVYNLARHFAMHKKDKAGQRGFQVSYEDIELSGYDNHYYLLFQTTIHKVYFF